MFFKKMLLVSTLGLLSLNSLQARNLSCTQVLNTKNNYVVTLQVKNIKRLLIQPSSNNGRYAQKEYLLGSVFLPTIYPIETPKYSCEDGTNKIIVWDNFAMIGHRFYSLDAVIKASTDV